MLSASAKEVLSLYRVFLRLAKQRDGLLPLVQQQFRRNAKAIRRTDTQRIEHLIRQGSRQAAQIRESAHFQVMN